MYRAISFAERVLNQLNRIRGSPVCSHYGHAVTIVFMVPKDLDDVLGRCWESGVRRRADVCGDWPVELLMKILQTL